VFCTVSALGKTLSLNVDVVSAWSDFAVSVTSCSLTVPLAGILKVTVNVADAPMLRLEAEEGETDAHPSGTPDTESFVLFVLSSPVFLTVTVLVADVFWVMLKPCIAEVMERVYFFVVSVSPVFPGLPLFGVVVVVVVLAQAPAEQPLLHSLAAHVPELHEYLWVEFLQLAPFEPVAYHVPLS